MYGNELPGRIGGMLDEDGCTWADAKDTAGLHTPGGEQHSIGITSGEQPNARTT